MTASATGVLSSFKVSDVPSKGFAGNARAVGQAYKAIKSSSQPRPKQLSQIIWCLHVDGTGLMLSYYVMTPEALYACSIDFMQLF